MADYEVWSESATVTSLDTGSPITMPVQHFANTARRPHAEYSWQNTVEMIEYFDAILSPYPYGDLKYGHALFTFGGAMEHPTVSSMGSLTASLSQSAIHSGPRADWIVAHELVHQWFGDSLRLARWGEIWLNEAFASYGEILWLEQKYGYDVAKLWLHDDKLFDFYPGTVRDPAPTLGLFSTTIYDKGAWVLHMLRQVIGRDGLIEAMRRYAERHRFQPVTTEDFVAVCDEIAAEQGGAQLVDGSLSWFFEQWLDREDRPELRFDWLQNASSATVLRVQQPGDVYRLPLLVRVDFEDETSADFDVIIDGADFVVELPTSKSVRRVALDPDGDWLLNKSTATSGAPSLAQLLPAVPNPFNPRVALRFFLAEPAYVKLRVFDMRGRLVNTLVDGLQPSDLTQVNWDGSDATGARVASGVYVVYLTSAQGVEQSQRVTLLE
jgi:aminopeptidase N